MSDTAIAVHAAFDEEAGVWFVESSDLHGVNAEAPTLDDLVAKLPDVILDLLDEDDAADTDIALQIVAIDAARCGCGGSHEGLRQAGPRPACRRWLPLRAPRQRRPRCLGKSPQRKAVYRSGDIDSRHMANKIMKDAGLSKAF